MAANQSVAPLAALPSLSAFNRVLALPWLDRSIAFVACVPVIYMAYYRFQHWHLGIPFVTATAGSLLLLAFVATDGSRHAILNSPADHVHSGFIAPAPQERIGLPQSLLAVTRLQLGWIAHRGGKLW